MIKVKDLLKVAGTAAVTLAMGTSGSFADGMEKKSIKDSPAEEPKRELQVTANFALTSEYVFRGFSQSAENPTVQAGLDVTYRWFYAGLWGSGIDFGDDPVRAGQDIAHVELDLYMGIKPVLGRFTFDFGGIYYTYPGAYDGVPGGIFRELNYFEFKAGVSFPTWKDGTMTATLFYSPEYTNQQGRVWTAEIGFSQVLPKIAGITPTYSSLYGYQDGGNDRYRAFTGNGSDNYFYWNSGVTLGFGDRFSLDFRYWDTNVKNNNAAAGFADHFCKGATFQCDERFVVTAKVTY